MINIYDFLIITVFILIASTPIIFFSTNNIKKSIKLQYDIKSASELITIKGECD